jgi:hypothetical protein
MFIFVRYFANTLVGLDSIWVYLNEIVNMPQKDKTL